MDKRARNTIILGAGTLCAAIGLLSRTASRAEPVALQPSSTRTATIFASRAAATEVPTDPLASTPRELQLKAVVQYNPNAHIPPQCYTKTTDEHGRVYNPCHTCHVSSRAPNYIDDAALQLAYDFSPNALANPWSNLFVDWRPEIASVSDADILAYIRSSNYRSVNGELILAQKLRALPSAWDVGDDGVWSGYRVDARFRFDAEGFDRTPDGGYTGWRAYAYHPLPGTFWPANGSLGDVLIRLPEIFRQDASGAFDLGLYKANLAVLEAAIQRADVAIDPVDEARAGVDLDHDGKLGRATRVKFVERPGGPGLSFTGKARLEQQAGRIQLQPGLFPAGTEFLHSLRYLDPTPDGVRPAARFKELRYARKHHWFSSRWLERRARTEADAKLNAPFERRAFGGNLEIGLDTGQGWRFQGFIEDATGELRPQTYEETVYCMGCHSGTGVTDDGIFSFGRKLQASAHARGWYHFDQRSLAGVADRALASGGSEYVAYLEHNGAGDEFRQNQEIMRAFFDARGKLLPAMRARLRKNVETVLSPSRARALALDKAYRRLVERQSFRLGRDLVLDGARNVHRQVPLGAVTGIREALPPRWAKAATPAP